MKDHFGQKLKRFREAKSWDQPTMAAFLEIGYRTYQTIEGTGKVSKTEVKDKIERKTGIAYGTQKVSHETSQPEFTPLLTQLMERQNQLMEMQNRILQEQKDAVSDRIKDLDANLSGLSDAQRESFAYLVANLQYEAKLRAAGDKKKEKQILNDLATLVELNRTALKSGKEISIRS